MSKKILIVDDIQENRYMLKSLLTGYGYEVVEAADGAAALELARSDPPDAVVTDLMMSGMDGFELCRTWMQDESLWRIPFVVYTATYTDEKDRRLILDLGADAYILKPSDPGELVQKIQESIEKAEPKTEVPSALRGGEFFERYAARLQEKLERKVGQLQKVKQSLVDYVSRCEAILDASPMAMVSLDRDLKIRTWNYEAERLFGYAECEVLGRSVESLIPAGKLNETKEKISQSVVKKDNVRYETERLHKDGHRLEVAVSLSFLGPHIGYIEVITDLAERRKVEQEKNKLEEQLAIAQRMEAVGRLAGGIAHDFNNLLTAVMAHAELIERDLEEGHPNREDAQSIREAGELATELTRQLLMFSRHKTIRHEVLDLNNIVREMEKMLKRLIGGDTELVVKLAEDLGRIEAGVSQMEQVIMNLAVNAKDAMPEGGRLIIKTGNVTVDREEAGAHPPMRPGRYVMMSVTDTGTGMDDETRTRVFEPFFTTKATSKGTGLGLSTVYGVVKQSNGFVWVYSESGTGSTFKIFLPRVDKPISVFKPGEVPAEAAGKGETILVVEDDDMVRELVKRVLERFGYRVLTAASGGEALTAAEKSQERIDLLLTDVVMPNMNGRKLARRMSAIQPSLKVVYTSGYTDEAIAHHGVFSHDVTLVEKPLSISALTSVVRSVLDGKVGGGETIDETGEKTGSR